MLYTPNNATTQVNLAKGRNKNQLSALAVIDPYLISIASLASRLIPEMQDAFTSIVNAHSNDGCEVTVLTPCGGIPSNPLWWSKDRVEIDGAFNQLIATTFNKLIDNIRDWHYRATRKHVGTLEIFDDKFAIDPPIEIARAVQAINLSDVIRKPLEDMLALSQKHRLGFSVTN
jgi:hypothetical protein